MCVCVYIYKERERERERERQLLKHEYLMKMVEYTTQKLVKSLKGCSTESVSSRIDHINATVDAFIRS